MTTTGASRAILKDIDTFVGSSGDEDDKIDALNQILLAVHGKKESFTQLIADLGDYLTNTDDLLRARGTLLLSEVLSRLPELQLNGDSIMYLCKFFTARLSDYPSVPEVLKGVIALMKYHNLSDTVVQELLRNLFNEVNVQSLSQTNRKVAFELLTLSLNRYQTATQELKSDFVFGFIQAMDGEKDPRNLLIVFRLVPIIINLFPDYTRFSEELFEVVSCYFPITFKPKSNDPAAISREDLITSLRNAMTSSPAFASFCLPFLLDKLSSDLKETKLDSLVTLSVAAGAFGNASEPFLEQVWSGLRLEYTGKGVVDGVKNAVDRVVVEFSQNLDGQPLAKWVNLIAGETMQLVKDGADPELDSEFVRILTENVASASKKSCCLVVDVVLPPLVDSNSSEISSGLLVKLLAVCAEQFTGSDENPMKQYTEKVTSLLMDRLSSNDTSAVDGLCSILESSLVSVEEEEKAVRTLSNLLLSSHRGNRDYFLTSLGRLSKRKPKLFNDIVLPSLFDSIQKDETKRGEVYQMLPSLCLHDDVIIRVVPRLMESLRQQFGRSEEDPTLGRTLYSIALTNAKSPTVCNLFVDTVVVDILDLLVERSLKQSDAVKSSFLQPFLSLLKVLLHNVGDEEKAKLVDVLIGKITDESRNFKAFSSSATASQVQLTLFSSLAVIYSSQSSGKMEEQHFLEKLREISVKNNDNIDERVVDVPEDDIRSRANQSIATIINRAEPSVTRNFVEMSVSECWAGGVLQERKRAVRCLGWIVKALLMRGEAQGDEIVDSIIQHLDDDEIQEELITCFQIMMREDEDILSKARGTRTRVLYRQKFFFRVLPLLLSNYNALPDQTKSTRISAIYNVTQELPQSVVASQVKTLIPVMTSSLDGGVPSIMQCTMGMFIEFFRSENTRSHLKENSAELIEKFLRVATADSRMLNRVTALRCLASVADHGDKEEVLKKKQRVVQGLVKLLDDHKRLVRKEAVKTRGVWINVN
ncbi:hypothetical protein PROFUN_03337 [Planoprotostelium fungivorum]|uniref:MMS19 nucleotide excision repair protein n=1 Tax=Planoprotostelium fungivorum TaxID=1890364 RepID=A0A2P6NWT8_9EUKA|nr:hypothetical protein PROFUN_03337 [Planoprotostelium fungivorum]